MILLLLRESVIDLSSSCWVLDLSFGFIQKCSKLWTLIQSSFSLGFL